MKFIQLLLKLLMQIELIGCSEEFIFRLSESLQKRRYSINC